MNIVWGDILPPRFCVSSNKSILHFSAYSTLEVDSKRYKNIPYLTLSIIIYFFNNTKHLSFFHIMNSFSLQKYAKMVEYPKI